MEKNKLRKNKTIRISTLLILLPIISLFLLSKIDLILDTELINTIIGAICMLGVALFYQSFIDIAQNKD